MSETISRQKLAELVGAWIGQGKRVAGPRRIKPNLVLYAPLASADELLLEGFIRPGNSIKEFVFPRHEKLYSYRLVGKQIELVDPPPFDVEQIIVGARPCDAAALSILDHVFNWDYRDPFYNRRRELTTVITLACREHDALCFCTSVGLGPGDERGSDVLLVDLGDGTYEVRCLTDKGRKLLAGQLQSSDKVGQTPSGPKTRFDMEAIRRFLDQHFEDAAWAELTLQCLGCGACAFECPTCHCFDIVDEGNAAGGARVRNWDACQFPVYSQHASGHNPRSAQDQRCRNRIYHKYRVYPEKFGDLLCTGCGNCTRNCPVGLGVVPLLEALRDRAAGPQAVTNEAAR